jgi:hypothetical protein
MKGLGVKGEGLNLGNDIGNYSLWTLYTFWQGHRRREQQ